MGLYTPSAVLRTGAADPTRSKAAYPPPRWVFGYLLIDCGQKVLIFNENPTRSKAAYPPPRLCSKIEKRFENKNLNGVHICPSLVQNPSQKHPQNLVKTGVQGAHFEGLGASFWSHFGGLGASFWSHFGGLGGVWLPSASWEASWVAPGRSWTPTWPQLGLQDGPQIEKKSMQKLIKKSMPFKIDFWSDFDGF